MAQRNFVDVDTFQRDTSLPDAAGKCGVHVDVSGNGQNQRIDCPFGCEGDHRAKREIAVDAENAAKQWKCHAYGCEMRGNLLCLMYGWLNGKRWSGDKLRGAEFNQVKEVIAGKAAEVRTAVGAAVPQVIVTAPEAATTAPAPIPKESPINPPLRLSDNEGSRGLMEPPIWEKLVRDVARMSPEASAYVRRHPSLSPEGMAKFHIGVMPSDGGGDKRGWSLRNHVVYPFFSESGEVIAFVGRDPHYEEKVRAYEVTKPEERDADKRPIKHRFPKGFHRGEELYGQQHSRLREPGYREAIARYGIVVVEGFNDVLRLDSEGIPAVAICSNFITDEQIQKLGRWSAALGASITLMFDCDVEGERGAADAAWRLLKARVPVSAAWSRDMCGGKFKDRQPEGMTGQELKDVLAQLE
jgi:hypothetical protein